MTYLTESIVLKKNYCGDYDRQYVILTRELGKITAVARSANKINSKLASHLDFFSLNQVMLASGHVFYRLAGAKIIRANKNLSASLLKISLASVFLEILDLLSVPNQPETLIFALAESCLSHLDQAGSFKENIIVFNRHLFELLSLTGYRPNLAGQKQAQLIALMVKIVETASDKQVKSFDFLRHQLIGDQI